MISAISVQLNVGVLCWIIGSISVNGVWANLLETSGSSLHLILLSLLLLYLAAGRQPPRDGRHRVWRLLGNFVR